jgi:PAS domain-containing protein
MEKSRWPAGGGEAGELIRGFYWSATSVGAVERWPERLRTLVELVLMNPAASALVWGPEGLLIYNDRYASICGSRHPHALGISLRDAGPEAWGFDRNMLESCRSGIPQIFRDAHFILEREGVLRESWFDLYYAPVCDNGEHFEVVLATVVEITDRMRTEQAREAHAIELQRLSTELDT